MIAAGEKIVEATGDATNIYVGGVEVMCEQMGVPTSAVMTWHMGRIVAGLVATENLDLDRTVAIIRRAAAMVLKRIAEQKGN